MLKSRGARLFLEKLPLRNSIVNQYKRPAFARGDPAGIIISIVRNRHL